MLLLDTPTSTDCPTDETLVEFDGGRLSSVEILSLAEHVSVCDHCNSTLAGIHTRSCAAGGLVSKLRGSCIPANVSGAHFGPYILTEKIGEGGIGEVYKAWQIGLERFVAVKKLRPEVCEDSDTKDLFRREGPAVASVEHPNVVQVFDCNQFDGQPYLCMELMPGGSLADRIASGPLEPRDAAELVCKLALAVEASHKRGILHRDLKPSNVFLAADGNPKIGDFGLAKWADMKGKYSAAAGLFGTPCYMAPEQTTDDGPALGPATDVYALGAILYETITGRPPVTGPDIDEILRRVRELNPVPPGRANSAVPPELGAICLKCLAKAPNDRYPSAAALAEALRTWLDSFSREPLASADSALAGGSRLSKHRWLALASAGLAGLIALGAMLYLPPQKTPQAPPDPDQPIIDIEARLAQGEAVALIGESGAPAWSRWRIGGNTAKTSIDDDGFFTIDAADVAVLELARDPRVDHYRIHADLRHEEGKRGSEIGLAWAIRDYPLATTSLNFWCGAWFDDIHTGTGQPAGNAAKQKPADNPATLGCRLFAEGDKKPLYDWRMRCPDAPTLFQATGGSARATWRRIVIDVDGGRAIGTWENGNKIGELSRPLVESQARTALTRMQPTAEDKPLLQAIAPSLNVRNAVGLYVRAGKVSFKNVVLEPVAD